MDSHLLDIYRDIRSLIQEPDEMAAYILYTTIGTITVRKFVYRVEARYVFLQGIDESGRDRIVGSSEQQLSTLLWTVLECGASDLPARHSPQSGHRSGNLRLLTRLLTQIERVLSVYDTQLVSLEIVEAARDSLVIGQA